MAADRDQLARRARAELERAADVDGTDPEVLFAAAEVAYRLDWSLQAAESRLRQLLAARPGHWRARLRLAECLVVTGKFNDAIGMARDAAERQPFSPRTLLRVGRVLHFARDYDEAARAFTAVLERWPDLGRGTTRPVVVDAGQERGDGTGTRAGGVRSRDRDTRGQGIDGRRAGKCGPSAWPHR